VDANGTRFHLLIGKGDWARCRGADDASPALAIDFTRAPVACGEAAGTGGFAWENATESLTLRPCLVQFDAPPNDTPPDSTGAGRRGAACDRFGNIYWIAGSSAEIVIIPAATGRTVHFWSPGDGLECEGDRRYGEFHAVSDAPPRPQVQLAGLAITDEHYLVVGVIEPAGFLVFDLHAGGPPQQITWPTRPPQTFVPFDLAPRPGGGVWVLDRLGRRYWALDRHFSVDSLDQPLDTLDPGRRDDFQPLDPGPVRRTAAKLFPGGVPIDAADPIAIEALPDGTVLILDRLPGGGARLLRDGIDQRFGAAAALEPFAIDAYDLVFVPADARATWIKGRLYVASAQGNQASAFDMESSGDGALTFTLSAEYFPMRLFGGKGLIAAGSHALYDFADGWVPLTHQRRPRYAASATLQTPVFDGREPACVWHRLMIDACLAADTALHVRSRAADEESTLAMTRWQREPNPYLRRDGSEFPLSRAPRAERDGTWELLFQRARGRYLQVELTLSGNKRATPRVRALRAYYPRFSYLHRYLPAVYRDEETSASFLDRFLANVEGFYTTIEDRIAAVQALFDVRSAPADTLDWLASWFGVALDPAWNDSKRRLFIQHAPEFFRQRGTARGLQNAIRLAIDDCIDPAMFSARPRRIRSLDQVRIVESYRMRRMPAVVAGDSTEEIGPREIPAAARWRATEGRTRLNTRYREFLADHGMTVPSNAEFTMREPDDGDGARLWRTFAQQTLGFVPSATAADIAAWRAFLARRYQASGSLSSVYGATSVETVVLPDRLPPDGRALRDWFDFESTVMAVRRNAHRFSVLVPIPRSQDNTEEFRRTRLDLVRRVVELEKPAHTVFDVKFYWALFRVGAARLGDDTLVYRGGREPDLLPPLRLGQGYLAESHLVPGHPQNVDQRRIVGRDTLDRQPATEETRA
jgi:phage tail-like protein